MLWGWGEDSVWVELSILTQLTLLTHNIKYNRSSLIWARVSAFSKDARISFSHSIFIAATLYRNLKISKRVFVVSFVDYRTSLRAEKPAPSPFGDRYGHFIFMTQQKDKCLVEIVTNLLNDRIYSWSHNWFLYSRGKKYVAGSCVPVLIYQLGDSGLLRKQDNNVQVT